MKQEWSRNWNSSRQPRKQRKYQYNAPAHVKQRKMRAPLSKELKTKHKRKQLGVRVGDEVTIMKGDFKGKTGKVEKIMKKNEAVVVSNVSRQKADGTKSDVPIKACNVVITKLNLEDSKRFKK
jgi:large subunit ribosomal protein L24